MKNIKSEAILWIQLVSFVVIWAAILYFTGTDLAINWEAVKKLPDVVTVYVIFSIVFAKWLWRLRIFKGWLVPFPNLQGTWIGNIESTWKDPTTGERIPAVRAILVIKQTFTSISCTLFSQESESFSTVAQITLDEETDAAYLNYNYSNRPKATIRERSAPHDGAARLRVVSNPERVLVGEFWTSRCTSGAMTFKFTTEGLLEQYQA
jgi:hypothetical protein